MFGSKWIVLLVSIAMLALFAFQFGCRAPTDEKMVNMMKTDLEAKVNALKQAGFHGYVGGFLIVDKVGSWKTTLEGPGTFVAFAFVEVDPAAGSPIPTQDQIVETVGTGNDGPSHSE